MKRERHSLPERCDIMNPSTTCQDDTRRDEVRVRLEMNGLDYLDVGQDQLTLTVYFLGKAPAQLLPQPDEDDQAYQARLKQCVRIEGGRRIHDIRVVAVKITQVKDPRTGEVVPDLDDWMTVKLDKYGDFSTYTLRLVDVGEVDWFYDHIDFTFKIDCANDLDCVTDDTCSPPVLSEPEIDYLAKDYASFRQLIMDRLALTMPDWKERHVPDIGVALVEVLAYVGDYLSYYQDAVATEAYLDTARRRISVRRHARLVDHRMHEGCNARAWVCVEVDKDLTLDPQNVFFITGLAGGLPAGGSVLKAESLTGVPAARYEAFEPILPQPIELVAAHSRLCFYTWENQECCLSKGATSATLRDSVDQPLQLKVGQVLIFEEVIGPKTGQSADADPLHRHAVRLTRVEPDTDPLNDTKVVEIAWASEDALPFPLCISGMTDAGHGCQYNEDITVARGNVVWVDHGRTVASEDLGVVPCRATQANCDCHGQPSDIAFVPGFYRPRLERRPLTFRQRLPVDDKSQDKITSAVSLMAQDDVRTALPQVSLKNIPAVPATESAHLRPLFRLENLSDPGSLLSSLRNTASPLARVLRGQLATQTVTSLDGHDESTPISDGLRSELADGLASMLHAWSPQSDLLDSQSDDRHFVVEIDDDGRAQLRFGDGELGHAPGAGSAFVAEYRVGNGVAGNVSAQTISHLVLREGAVGGDVLRVRNPLPAQGGVNPEPIADVKLFAPTALRKELQRAITADDYAQLVEREFKKKREVQGAAAVLDWTGSWYEARVTVDPARSDQASPPLLDEIERYLDDYRRVGHDLAVLPAHYVPLDVELTVCVLPHFLRGHVEADLRFVFSNRVLASGKLGFFHPDRLSFGKSIRLSQLVATAQAVTGVESVQVTRLERLYEGPNRELAQGILKLGAREIARLDNDPSFPEHGKLEFKMEGGR